ncbi:MAG: HAD-IIB family hydrolase, partial [Gammaproteobacteria bacterium]|nr:HAD-IIB family hydrolase [Gammaproteobacteria bacterium]
MATDKPVLLCCDLDRTLIPNGPQPESPQAREKFRQLIERPEVKLAYVSGRDKQLLLSAIADYDLPVPDYAIGDVGTSLYHIRANEWRLSGDWHQHISQDWHGLQQPDLQEYLHTFPQLELQETEKQNRYKLSYYVDPKVDISTLLTVIDQTLQANNIRANLVWSIDEQQNTGLLDILPASANKLHAINYLIAHEGFQTERT